MALDYFEWEAGDVIVLHLSGPVTLGQGTRKFRDLIDATLKSGKKKILLNMSEVYNMDSSGLGELVAAHTTVTREGGILKLVKLTRRVHDAVQLTKIYRLFEVYEDEDTAVGSFQ